jgi:redox-sensitive bicupin YhaK (pirin superfamily)
LHINADARALAATLLAGQKLEHSLNGSSLAYLVPASGLIEVNGARTNARDGLAISTLKDSCASAPSRTASCCWSNWAEPLPEPGSCLSANPTSKVH